MVANGKRRCGEGGLAVAAERGVAERAAVDEKSHRAGRHARSRSHRRTVAVKVTDWLSALGFDDDATVVVVAALLTTCGLVLTFQCCR